MKKIIIDKVNNLRIKKETICNINNRTDVEEINIFIESGNKLVINEYSEIEKKDYKLNIVQQDNTEFIYNHSFKVNKLYNLDINIELKGNNSKNLINIHGINDFGKSNIKVDGKVLENTKDNELDEKIKILNINNGSSSIFPNMLIDTKNVIANHAASITNINEDYLFYLNCKGIKDEQAKELIIKGFLDNEAKE